MINPVDGWGCGRIEALIIHNLAGRGLNRGVGWGGRGGGGGRGIVCAFSTQQMD